MGNVTESIFSGKSKIIPLAEVHHIDIDNRVDYEGSISVILNGTTWNQEIDTYNNSVYLRREEAEDFKAAWCRYRAELESETIQNIMGN